MDTHLLGALWHRKASQRLIGMYIVLALVFGLFATFQLLTHPSSAYAAGNVQINAGGGAAAPFVADTDFSGGRNGSSTSHSISTTGVTNPAPQAVYQTSRVGTSTYTIPGLA